MRDMVIKFKLTEASQGRIASHFRGIFVVRTTILYYVKKRGRINITAAGLEGKRLLEVGDENPFRVRPEG